MADIGRAGPCHEPGPRLARVFRFDVTCCEYCGGPVRIIASLTDPAVLERILTARGGAELHGPARGPPQDELALG